MSRHPFFCLCLALQVFVVLTIGFAVFAPESAEAQVVCPFSPNSALLEGDSDADSCTIPAGVGAPTFANGFKIQAGANLEGVQVTARVNNAGVVPNLVCGGTPSYGTTGVFAFADYGGVFGTRSCTASYVDGFGETVSFTFSMSQVLLFGAPIAVDTSSFTVSTGGFDIVAPTVSVGAITSNGNGTFAVPIVFSEDVRGFDASDLVVTGGTVTSITGSNGNYVATITPTGSGPISVSVPVAVVVDQGQNPNFASASAATIASNSVTELLISDYLQGRAVNILQSQVRLTDFLNPATQNGFSANGSGGSDAGSVEFSGALGGADAESGLQVWARVSGAWSETALTESSFFTAQAGLHTLLGPDVVLGAMLQLDQTDGENTSTAVTSDFEGWGWMVGPYIAAKLPNQPLFFEARIAWGQSYNEISPFGTYTDDFDTERWLLTGRVEGDFVAGAWSFNPAVRLSYFREEQEAYTDSLSNPVLAQVIAIGEVEFGPTVRRNFALESGGLLQAELGVSGLWTFAAEGGLASNPTVLDEDDLRARLNAALRYETVSGWSLTSDLFLDGVGVEDYSAAGGNLKVLRAF